MSSIWFIQPKVLAWCCIVISYYFVMVYGSSDFCSANSGDNQVCGENTNLISKPRYLFYDVNPQEGFNLRRDVYMRLAVMIQRLSKSFDWHLVLPPWPQLYHWRSSINQKHLPWSLFFDVPSLQKFAPVLDFQQYFTDQNHSNIEEVYVLQHYKEDWEAGRFDEKQSVETCNEIPPYVLEEDGMYSAPLCSYNNVHAFLVKCLSFHGRASQLSKFLSRETKAGTVLIDHAEVVLHDSYGDEEYWKARRSMRFSQHLVERAQKYRKEVLNSFDKKDQTVRPVDWQNEMSTRSAVGGPYLCVHLRRRDFLWGRRDEVPSLSSAAQQLQIQLYKLNLNTVFIATDAPEKEFQEIQSLLHKFKVVKYSPTVQELRDMKDGGVAIVEQIICSHARFFIGTYESTFSFRIQEEREIMGFNPDTTFNRLCGDAANFSCVQPSRWLAVF